MKVVLDTNIFISAVLKPASGPGRIVDLAQAGRIRLLVSESVLSELKAVLSYPHLKKLHRKSPRWIKAFISELAEKSEVTPDILVVDAVMDDPSDNIYLACAVEGQADYIVSGDHHLKDLKTFQGIPIIDPAAFLKIISETK